MDLVTVETKKGLRLLHTYAPYAQQKIHYITNGYDEDFLKTNSLEPTFEAKKNTIITI